MTELERYTLMLEQELAKAEAILARATRARDRLLEKLKDPQGWLRRELGRGAKRVQRALKGESAPKRTPPSKQPNLFARPIVPSSPPAPAPAPEKKKKGIMESFFAGEDE